MRHVLRRLTLGTLATTLIACGLPDPQPAHQQSGLGVAGNAAECPPDWATARSWCSRSGTALACSSPGQRCVYAEAGDWISPDASTGSPGHWADALLLCFEGSGASGAVAEWRCAQ